MISREVGLGVHPANSYSFYVIASPAGAYFKGGITPVSVWLSTEYVRAAPGGTGAAKFAGNYAASLAAQSFAEEKGCDQVVWLDAAEHTWIEEMGGMNLAFILQGDSDSESAELVTPELSGSLLPGVTRESLLQRAADDGLKVTERKFSVEEWKQTAASGEMREAFACGTAAVITPVGTVKDKTGAFQVNGGESGEITMRLREHLTGIQRGTVEDATAGTTPWSRLAPASDGAPLGGRQGDCRYGLFGGAVAVSDHRGGPHHGQDGQAGAAAGPGQAQISVVDGGERQSTQRSGRRRLIGGVGGQPSRPTRTQRLRQQSSGESGRAVQNDRRAALGGLGQQADDDQFTVPIIRRISAAGRRRRGATADVGW